MQEEHFNQPNIFNGGMNLEDDLHMIEQNDYIHAYNILNTSGALPGAVTLAPGNVEVANDLLPGGTNTVIGAAEDKRTGTVFYFVYNSNDDHCIFKYIPNDFTGGANGTIELVATGEALGFKVDWKIHSCKFIDNKFLYWIDAVSAAGTIEGNPPYKINAVKGNITNKKLEYELMAGLPGQGQFATSLVDGNTILVRMFLRSTNAIVSTETFSAATLNGYISDPYGFLQYFTTTMNADIIANQFEFEYCEECRVQIRAKNALYYLDIFETAPPIPDQNIMFVRTNHYPRTLRQEHLDVIKWPPVYELNPEYTVDPTYPANNVNQTIFQFRVRYWFDDGEKSAWGPISILALPIDKSGTFLENLNTIKLNFTDDRLNDADSLNIIRKVELAFREGNNGLFRSIDILDICEIGINTQIYDFRNDKMYSIVTSDDVVTSGQTQAFKLFDSVPRIAGAMEAMSDLEGNNRLFYGANLENYNNPDCVDLTWDFETHPEDECFVTISGRVDISNTATGNMHNDGYFRSRQVSELVPADPDELVLNGFVVYLAGTTYYGISESFEIPAVVSPTGLFEIRNVPRGRYIMRVANWRCRFDNTKGEIYNLNNGVAWQRTSAPVLDCAGSVAAGESQYERTLDLTTAGPTFDLLTEPGYGPIEIQNFEIGVLADAIPFVTAYSGSEFYFLDNEAQDMTPLDARKGAIGVERQSITLVGKSGIFNFQLPLFGVISNLETDHNGYAWTIWNGGEFDPVFINSNLSKIKNLMITVRDPCGGVTRDLWWFGSSPPDSGMVMFNGGMEGLWLGTEADTGGDGLMNTGFTQQTWQANIYNADVDFTTKNKTIIQGNIVESTNTPVSNVLVTYQRNGRQQFTDILGGYSISAYCPWDSDDRSDDDLTVTYPTDNCYDYPPNVPTQTPAIADYCGAPYNSTTPYAASLVTFPFVGAIVQLVRYLKRGGVYRTGIVYEDRANRKATVAEGELLRVPYFTEPGAGFTRASAVWNIDSVPPEWATHYRVVLTNDSYYRRYLQWVAESVEYAIIASIDAAPVNTTYGNADSTHVMIELSGMITDETPAANGVEWFFLGTNLQGFTAQPKDRVRFILDELGDLVSTTQILDFEIVGIYRNGVQYYVVIETPELFQEIKAGWLIEVYTPKKNDEVVFFEMGETHEIINAGLSTRRHGGSTQNQIIGVQPATGFLVGGDTYWRTKNYSVADTVTFNYQVENANITDRFDSTFTDIGRPNVKDDDFGERFYFNRIRLSGIYIPDSKINGLSAFKSIDVQALDMRHGNIMKLIAADNVMLAICQNKTQPIYVGKDRILDLSGAGSVGRSDQILNVADELKYDFGTHNPESIIEQDGHVYGIDLYQGVAWRYSANGQFPISDYKAKRYFNQIGHTLFPLDRADTKVYGYYDREYGRFGMTIEPNTAYEDGITIEFSEEKNRWNNFNDFIGEWYQAVGDRLVAFKNGQLWVHGGDGHNFCNFFGTQYKARVRFASNVSPRAVKNWWNISIQADNQWSSPYIFAPKSYSYPNGMLSELPPAHFSIEEGIWKADLLRDMTDPDPRFNSITNPAEREIAKLLRGRVLRGEILIIEIECVDSSQYSILRRVDVEQTMSMDTKA